MNEWQESQSWQAFSAFEAYKKERWLDYDRLAWCTLHGGGNTDLGGKSKYYEIPIRALIAKDIDGLLMAGRCISGDWVSFSSYRVTGEAVSMGQAAGTLAAANAAQGKLPRNVAWQDIKSYIPIYFK